ncbi:MAG: DUF1800 family protein [Sphingomonadales bacterium]
MPLPDRNTQAAIAVTRFGLGAHPGEIREASGDPRGWLLRQLAGPAPVKVAGADRLSSSRESLAEYARLFAVRRDMRRAAMDEGDAMDGDGTMDGDGAMDDAEPRPAAFSRSVYKDEVDARVRTAVVSRQPLAERMVWFWSNHFTVSGGRSAVLPAAGAFEREAIRPHVLGRFEDMLLAATLHPAMLLYLDQQKSVGPSSQRGRRSGRGLNENLGREVLELHTLGVDGGYTQADVTTFAKALTGWTVGGFRRTETAEGEAIFVRAIHEPGAKTIMGAAYGDDGAEQARKALRDFARHPSTARHVARKLARHFVADEPPEGAVDALARTFRDTGGDLRRLTEAAVSLDAAWGEAPVKVKTPNEYVVSTLRGLDAGGVDRQMIFNAMVLLGQRTFSAPSPAGWPDRAADWAGPDAVYRRIEWAAQVGRRLGDRAGDPAGLARSMLGARASPRLLGALAGAESPAQAVALLLSSPDFQRR